MAAIYSRLLTKTDDQVKADMDPRDAIKLVRRLRRVSIFLRLKGELITERLPEGRYRSYDYGGNVGVTARVAIDKLTDWAEFSERKVAAGKSAGLVEVTRLGDCLFLG